ncbi:MULTISPECIES: N-acetyl-gamma-glutamyl-phosphate reductase [unclassified Hyphomicrobium]|uniref:N-acetyl-gamma-glutamyl-phosphate reductase n=1 Tax=unclassified Hyphomicrobium TaxID=2619925 RepID=UPI000213DF8C|nr:MULTISPECIES: N-acetyl-gamma-glutamyl-phosphate reductase [unclassified Hyphomicrobium]CCB65828.1 N-acetylglutamate semialdehyde dehydrogenase (NAGSA dehydrogenase) or N-acetyl-gamma-glutamylphosphate reductase, NAD(P)-binding [Hyphomicrobium sp. MC1]
MTTATQTKLARVFIDGEAGTTGLEIRERLAGVAGIDVKSIDPAKRKDRAARADMLRDVDLVVLCLPDDAARETVALADELGAQAPKIVDASTAHRVAEGWAYGFAELTPGHADVIRRAMRVANPGCYPTGGIALLRPLVDAGIIEPDYPITVNAVSGYSGGGRTMIEAYEAGTAPSFELYGLGLEHKHVPELQRYSGLSRRPIFVPSVGNFRQGMLVSVPLHLDTLPGKPCLRDIERVLEEHYRGSTYVSVIAEPSAKMNRLEAEALNGTDKLELYVFGKAALNQAVLVARLDNLGKGAAGAAVQNIKLMLGL